MLWKKTEQPVYAVLKYEDVSEEELKQKRIRYIRNDQADVYYIETPYAAKLKNYTFRALGTPLTIVFDGAVVVLGEFLAFGGNDPKLMLMMPTYWFYDPDGEIRDYGIQRYVDNLNKIASRPQGEKAVSEQLVKAFSVTSGQIRRLRDQGLEYGDIAATVAFSKTMSGGCTDENIDIVFGLRQEKTEWDDISRLLQSRVSGTLNMIAHSVNKPVRNEHKILVYISRIDKLAAMPQEEIAVNGRLPLTFPDREGQIRKLREQGLTFGDITATLALAESMTGGGAGDQVNAICELRQAGAGWEEIARISNVKPENFVERLESITKDMKKDVKKAAASAAF